MSVSDMGELRRRLERNGFQATKTRGGHWKFCHPQMEGPVFASSTPSDHRATKNLLSMLRRKMDPATVSTVFGDAP